MCARIFMLSANFMYSMCIVSASAFYPYTVCRLLLVANALLRIICLFLTFLAVCDAVLGSASVLAAYAVYSPHPPMRRERLCSLTIRLGWLITQNDLFYYIFCQTIWANLQTHTAAIKGRFFFFVPVNRSLISVAYLHTLFTEWR